MEVIILGYDVFISYKESDGKLNARELSSFLKVNGYSSVYYNEVEKKEGCFTGRLEEAIKSCTDFILVLTNNVINAVTNKNFDRDCDDFDYVCWEISKACEYNKHVIILNTGVCFAPNPRYKYAEMQNLMINSNTDKRSYLHLAEAFMMSETLLNALETDKSDRMLLRRVIYNVLSLKYKSKGKNKLYSDKECVFNKQALEGLCEYITKDNSITTEIENCKSAEALIEYLNGTPADILKNFCEIFSIESSEKDSSAISIRIKDDSVLSGMKMDQWEVLTYLYNSYNAMNIHEDYGCNRKKYLNRTISDYILALSWNKFFILNKDKRYDLVNTIIPTLIDTHNHAQGYLYALIEKGRFDGKDEWLFCNMNDNDDIEYAKRVRKIVGEFYKDVFNTDMSRMNFVDNLYAWFNYSESRFMNYCLELIKDYNCCDALIWNFSINNGVKFANKNRLSILRGFFYEYVDKQNVKVVLRMIEQGLKEYVYYTNNPQNNKKLYDMLCIVAKKKETAECYGHGINKALHTFWKKGQYKEEIKEIVDNACNTFNIPAFKPLHHIIADIKPDCQSVQSESVEEILQRLVNETDEGILVNNNYFYALDRIKINKDNVNLYNKAVSRLLDVCTFENKYIGLKKLLYLKYGKIWFDPDNKRKLFELIKDFVCKYEYSDRLEAKHYQRLFKIISGPEFNSMSMERADFRIAVFNDERINVETKMMLFNLWDDPIVRDKLKHKLLEKDINTKKTLSTIFRDTNRMWINRHRWKFVFIYPLITDLLAYDVFIELDSDIQNGIIHHTKTKQEYNLYLKELIYSLINAREVWDGLDIKVKTALVMHIDCFFDEFKNYEVITVFLDKLIEDIASMCYNWSDIKNIYGVKEETLMYHLIYLYRRKLWKTAKLCAVAQIKLYEQLLREEQWEYQSRELVLARQQLFPLALSNPCIRELTMYFAKVNYLKILQNINKIALEKDVLRHNINVLKEINQGKFPLWFGKEVKTKNKFSFFSKSKQESLKKVNGVDFEDVHNCFQKYDRRLDDSQPEKELLDRALESENMHAKKTPIDFADGAEKIILWKNSDTDKNIYVLKRKKLFATYYKSKDLYQGLKFNALLCIPQMCDEIDFDADDTNVNDVSTEIEQMRELIESKFRDVLIADSGTKYAKFDRFIKNCSINVRVKEVINEFFFMYGYYVQLTKIESKLASAFAEIVQYTKYEIMKYLKEV